PRTRVDPDLPPHRNLGNWESPRCRLESDNLSRAWQYHSARRPDHVVSRRAGNRAQSGFANTASRTDSGFTAVEYLPRLTHWLWNINLVSAVPHLGARSICLCSRAGRDVARRSFEKIWTLRPPSPGPAVTPRGRAAMVRNTAGASPCQHYLHRPGHDRATPPRLDARLLQRHAHRLYFSRHRQRQHP